VSTALVRLPWGMDGVDDMEIWMNRGNLARELAARDRSPGGHALDMGANCLRAGYARMRRLWNVAEQA